MDSNAYWLASNGYSRNVSFLLADGERNNGTLNPFPYDSAYWDFGIGGYEGVGYTYALLDGTIDTVDIAMAFSFNQTLFPIGGNTTMSIICSKNGVEVHDVNTVNELEVVRHFYVAQCKF